MEQSETKNTKPNCYECVHRRKILGNAHSRCNNFDAKTSGNNTGIRRGWFKWPLNFDPVWLVSCDGFSTNKEHNKPDRELSPLAEIFAILK